MSGYPAALPLPRRVSHGPDSRGQTYSAWREGQGIARLPNVQPVHAAAYIEHLAKEMSAPSVKQHLACIRMLFDWLVTGQVMPSNPAHSVRGRVTR